MRMLGLGLGMGACRSLCLGLVMGSVTKEILTDELQEASYNAAPFLVGKGLSSSRISEEDIGVGMDWISCEDFMPGLNVRECEVMLEDGAIIKTESYYVGWGYNHNNMLIAIVKKELRYLMNDKIKYNNSMIYRKKPIAVEAVQLQYDDVLFFNDNTNNFITCIGDKESHYFEIQTLEGTMRAYSGDYVIRGVWGEIYPCRKDIFEETYELIEE